jgi:hypothetical protein
LAGFLVLASLTSSSVHAATVPFSISSGLFNYADTLAEGLSAAPGRETITVFAPSASTDHYSNGVVVIGWKGNLYCQWQSSATDEDSPDTWVAFSKSADAKTWSKPAAIAKAGTADYKTSGGWWVNGDTLVAFVNVWPSSLASGGGYAYYSTTTDGTTWSALQHVKMSDGTDMAGIIEQDPHALPDGRILCAAHFQPGLLVNPIYTDDSSGIRGWKKGKFTSLSTSSTSTQEMEPSWYRRADGVAVMMFRDQNSSFRKLASTSSDRGATWTTAVLTNFPDSRAKQSAGNLPDGTAFAVNNPDTAKRRMPLAVTLSKDGQTFTKSYYLRKGGSDLQAQRYTGQSKGLGFSYPKSVVYGDYLYAGYSTNKEDVEITRVPLTGIELNASAVDGRTPAQTRSLPGAFARELVLVGTGFLVAEIRSLDGNLVGTATGTGSVSIGSALPRGLYALRLRDSRGTSSGLVRKFE